MAYPGTLLTRLITQAPFERWRNWQFRASRSMEQVRLIGRKFGSQSLGQQHLIAFLALVLLLSAMT